MARVVPQIHDLIPGYHTRVTLFLGTPSHLDKCPGCMDAGQSVHGQGEGCTREGGYLPGTYQEVPYMALEPQYGPIYGPRASIWP